jgi:hypothetical protein
MFNNAEGGVEKLHEVGCSHLTYDAEDADAAT